MSRNLFSTTSGGASTGPVVDYVTHPELELALANTATDETITAIQTTLAGKQAAGDYPIRFEMNQLLDAKATKVELATERSRIASTETLVGALQTTVTAKADELETLKTSKQDVHVNLFNLTKPLPTLPVLSGTLETTGEVKGSNVTTLTGSVSNHASKIAALEAASGTVSGILAVEKGGTGSGTTAGARSSLGLGSLATASAVDWATQVVSKPVLGALAAKAAVDYATGDVINKPTLGSLAAKSTVDYTTEVTSKPTLGALASKSTVDYNTEVINKPVAGETVLAGTGLTKTGNTLSVNAAQPGITSLGTLSSLALGGSATGYTITNYQTGLANGAFVGTQMGVNSAARNNGSYGFVYQGGVGSTSNYMFMGLGGVGKLKMDGNGNMLLDSNLPNALTTAGGATFGLNVAATGTVETNTGLKLKTGSGTSVDYSIMFNNSGDNLHVHLSGADDPVTHRHYQFGYYTGSVLGTWNSKASIDTYNGNISTQGLVTASAVPTTAAHLTNKQYVDAQVAAIPSGTGGVGGTTSVVMAHPPPTGKPYWGPDNPFTPAWTVASNGVSYRLNASSYGGVGFSPISAFDESTTTHWSSIAGFYADGTPEENVSTTTNVGQRFGPWLEIQTDTPTTLTDYRLLGLGGTNASKAPSDWILCGSNDGTTWTEVHTVTGHVWGPSITTFTPSPTPTVSYKSWRLLVTKCLLGSAWIAWMEVRGSRLTFTAPHMTIAGKAETGWLSTGQVGFKVWYVTATGPAENTQTTVPLPTGCLAGNIISLSAVVQDGTVVVPTYNNTMTPYKCEVYVNGTNVVIETPTGSTSAAGKPVKVTLVTLA